LSLISKSY